MGIFSEVSVKYFLKLRSNVRLSTPEQGFEIIFIFKFCLKSVRFEY